MGFSVIFAGYIFIEFNGDSFHKELGDMIEGLVRKDSNGYERILWILDGNDLRPETGEFNQGIEEYLEDLVKILKFVSKNKDAFYHSANLTYKYTEDDWGSGLILVDPDRNVITHVSANMTEDGWEVHNKGISF